jgi:hypothetical protein
MIRGAGARAQRPPISTDPSGWGVAGHAHNELELELELELLDVMDRDTLQMPIFLDCRLQQKKTWL